LSSATSDKEILVPLTASLYVPGRIIDTEKVLVDIGTGKLACHRSFRRWNCSHFFEPFDRFNSGYFVEKNVADAQELLDRKIGIITGNADNLQGVARQKQKNLEVIIDMMRARLAQNQQGEAPPAPPP
jgi:prefoldin alpha subunit